MHDLCRMTMVGLRADAKKLGVQIPKGLRCESAISGYFYIYDREGDACCRWEARASYIDGQAKA